jgi:hypothetical protein
MGERPRLPMVTPWKKPFQVWCRAGRSKYIALAANGRLLSPRKIDPVAVTAVY